MAILAAGASITLTLASGEVLSIEPGGSGVAVLGPGDAKWSQYRVGPGPGKVGPFGAPQVVYLSSTGAAITYTQGDESADLAGSSTPAATIKWAVIGDSRMVDQGQVTAASDGILRAKSCSAKNWCNWVARLRGGIDIIANGAHGGWRSDQYLGNLSSVLAVAPDVLIIGPGALNDISQSYPTQSTAAATALANIEAAVSEAASKVKAIVVCTEPGSTDLSTAYIKQTGIYNAGLRGIAARHPNVRVFDIRPILQSKTTTAAQIAFRAGYLYDNAHYAAPAAKALAEAFISQFPDLLGATVKHRLAASVLDDFVIDGVSVLPNGTFTATSGGTSSGAVTGQIPQYWKVDAAAGASVSVSTADRADGVGKDVVLTITATGATAVRLHCDLQASGVSGGTTRCVQGNPYRGACEVAVDASSNMLPPMLRTYVWTSKSNYSVWDMASGTNAMPSGAYSYALVTEFSPVQSTDGNAQAVVDFDVQLQFAAAGSATVRVGRAIVDQVYSVSGYVVGS